MRGPYAAQFDSLMCDADLRKAISQLRLLRGAARGIEGAASTTGALAPSHHLTPHQKGGAKTKSIRNNKNFDNYKQGPNARLIIRHPISTRWGPNLSYFSFLLLVSCGRHTSPTVLFVSRKMDVSIQHALRLAITPYRFRLGCRRAESSRMGSACRTAVSFLPMLLRFSQASSY